MAPSSSAFVSTVDPPSAGPRPVFLFGLHALSLLLALSVAGCASGQVARAEKPQTEHDLIVSLAFDALVASGAIDPRFQLVEPALRLYRPRPGPSAERASRTERVTTWTVTFHRFDRFGNPEGRVSTLVRRTAEPDGVRYETGR